MKRLNIDILFILKWSAVYNQKNKGSSDELEEKAIFNWLSKIDKTKYLNKPYFIRLSIWKTPRYHATRSRNAGKKIIEITRLAYRTKGDLIKLRILKQLDGVGNAVASTILYYLQPNEYPMFDFHVRNTLIEAQFLTQGQKAETETVWLKYTSIIRTIAKVNNVKIRTLEKALFAYDKWGPGASSNSSVLNTVSSRTNNGGGQSQVPKAVKVEGYVSYNNKPRWEITFKKDAKDILICNGGPFDLNYVQQNYVATLQRLKVNYVWLIRIELTIDGVQYDATLHYNLGDKNCWISDGIEDPNGKNDKLRDVLPQIGVAVNTTVNLVVKNNEMTLAR